MTREGSVALVTGGARRVGRAICLELARHGYEVWVHYANSRTEADELCSKINADGGSAMAFGADLGSRVEQDNLVSSLKTRLTGRKLSLVVHNASVFEAHTLETLEDSVIDEAFALHATAPLRLARALAPHMARGDDHTLMVMMLDAALLRPPRAHAHYAASKGALAALVPALCRELAPNVRVVGVSPGQVCWPDSYDEAKRKALRDRIPQGRVGTPEEIATLIRFLAKEGTYINGSTITVDGGASTVGIDR